MGDIGQEFINIRDALREMHAAYINKFGVASMRHAGNDTLAMTRILAKMKLVAKALVESGVIDEVDEQTVLSRNRDFPMSLRLGKKGIPHGIYLLNEGKGIIVASSVGAALSSKTMSGRISLVLDEMSDDCKRFDDVLSPSFDWMQFSLSVLSSIHEVVYSRHEVIMESVLREGEDPSPS